MLVPQLSEAHMSHAIHQRAVKAPISAEEERFSASTLRHVGLVIVKNMPRRAKQPSTLLQHSQEAMRHATGREPVEPRLFASVGHGPSV